MDSPPHRPPWLQLALVWSIVGLLLSGLLYLEVYFPLDTATLRAMPGWMFFTQVARALLWIPLTPVVFELRRRVPFAGWGFLPGLAIHAAFATAFMMWIYIVRLWCLHLHLGLPLEYFGIDVLLDSFAVRTLADFVIYWLVLGVGYTLDLQRAREHESIERAQMETRLVEAQLGALRQQMHPHFLHNALNAIAELVRGGENAAAVEAIVKLSRLQRRLMGNVTDREGPLRDELAFVADYLDLERLRFGDRLTVVFDVDPAAEAALAPCLLLQPLVENAAKHGIARRLAPGRIAISARRDGRWLVVRVENDVPEARAEADLFEGHSGIGLPNLRQRLARLHGADHALTLDIDVERGAHVEVRLPFRTAEDKP